jgi:hypothetical protein
MSTKKVNLLELSDSEKAIIIREAKTYLHKQVSEARLFRICSILQLQLLKILIS